MKGGTVSVDDNPTVAVKLPASHREPINMCRHVTRLKQKYSSAVANEHNIKKALPKLREVL